jgi:hypothetical protein
MPRKRPTKLRRAGFVVILLAAFVAATEMVLHIKPTALPSWYREQFPVMGVEFVQPGILSRTPIEGYPVPGPQRPYAGPPPAGLVAPTPLVDPVANPDPVRYPLVVLPIDANGFSNVEIPEVADILFVGDSFTLSVGGTEPPGLQRLLSESSGWTVYNIGIPGIGPIRERWLLEHYGLALKPQAVVWFFFGGNDLTDAEKTQARLDTGAKFYTDNPAYKPVPTFLALDFLISWTKTFDVEERARPRMSKGIRLDYGPDEGVDVWFSPFYVRTLLTDKPGWKKRAGWDIFTREIGAVKKALDARGIPLVLVYVPTKIETMLPYIGDQLDMVWDMVTFHLGDDTPMSEEDFLSSIQLNLDVLESLVQVFCERSKIPFLSATPLLRDLVEQGRLPYLSADTHWNDVGGASLLAPLQQTLAGLGVEQR